LEGLAGLRFTFRLVGSFLQLAGGMAFAGHQNESGNEQSEAEFLHVWERECIVANRDRFKSQRPKRTGMSENALNVENARRT
jgi:hypothetical protein